MVVYAPAQIISAPAQLITAPAQPPATGAVVYTALLFWNIHTFYLIDFGVPKMGFLVFLLGGIWRGVCGQLLT